MQQAPFFAANISPTVVAVAIKIAGCSERIAESTPLRVAFELHGRLECALQIAGVLRRRLTCNLAAAATHRCRLHVNVDLANLILRFALLRLRVENRAVVCVEWRTCSTKKFCVCFRACKTDSTRLFHSPTIKSSSPSLLSYKAICLRFCARETYNFFVDPLLWRASPLLAYVRNDETCAEILAALAAARVGEVDDVAEPLVVDAHLTDEAVGARRADDDVVAAVAGEIAGCSRVAELEIVHVGGAFGRIRTIGEIIDVLCD